MLNSPHNQTVLPNLYFKFPLLQFETTAPSPVPYGHRELSISIPFTIALQDFDDCYQTTLSLLSSRLTMGTVINLKWALLSLSWLMAIGSGCTNYTWTWAMPVWSHSDPHKGPLTDTVSQEAPSLTQLSILWHVEALFPGSLDQL